MRHLVFKSPVLGFCLLLTCSCIHADIIDNGTFTTDTTSGLDWLDVTLSVNKSYNYMLTQFGVGGEYEGWRHATSAEYNQLVSNYTGITITTTDPFVFSGDVTDGLVSVLGSTLDSLWINDTGSTYDAIFGFPEGEGIDYTHGVIADIATFNSVWTARLVDDDSCTSFCFDTSTAYANFVGLDGAGYGVGHFLVRNSTVPVPAAIWLFLTGMIGLVGIATRKNKIK